MGRPSQRKGADGERELAMIPFYVFEMVRAKERRRTRLLTVAAIVLSIIGLWGWVR